MAYKVTLTNAAKKQLKALDRKTLLLVASAIDELESSRNPLALPNAKKLQGVPDGWRWRVGTYRILATVNNNEITIKIFRIKQRKDAYKNL